MAALTEVLTDGPTASPVIMDEFLRGRADYAKPTYTELRVEGLSNPAIQIMHEARDMLAAGHGFYHFAKWFAGLYRTVPLSEADSWPDGKPDHWAAWDEQRYGMPLDYDPTDAEQGPLERGWSQNRREALANPALAKEWD